MFFAFCLVRTLQIPVFFWSLLFSSQLSCFDSQHYFALSHLPLTCPWPILVLDLKSHVSLLELHVIAHMVASRSYLQEEHTHPGHVLNSLLKGPLRPSFTSRGQDEELISGNTVFSRDLQAGPLTRMEAMMHNVRKESYMPDTFRSGLIRGDIEEYEPWKADDADQSMLAEGEKDKTASHSDYEVDANEKDVWEQPGAERFSTLHESLSRRSFRRIPWLHRQREGGEAHWWCWLFVLWKGPKWKWQLRVNFWFRIWFKYWRGH